MPPGDSGRGHRRRCYLRVQAVDHGRSAPEGVGMLRVGSREHTSGSPCSEEPGVQGPTLGGVGRHRQGRKPPVRASSATSRRSTAALGIGGRGMLGTVPMGRSHKPALGFSVEGRSADRCAMSGRGLWRRAGRRRDLSVDGRWPPFSSTAVASFVREEPRFRPGGSSDGTPGAVPPEVVRRAPPHCCHRALACRV